MSLTELLLATQDPAKNAAAEEQIRNAELSNAEQYFIALAQELANAEKPTIARQLSGLLLKNGLSSKDAGKNNALRARWTALPAQTRSLVKECATSALVAAETDVGKAAAQVLAKVGRIEIPPGEWDGLVPLLLKHVTNADPRARQIALVTFGYLCEDLVFLAREDGVAIGNDISNNILTAIVQGMRDSDNTTKLEAVRAFYHAVVLAQSPFRNDVERNVIMQVLHEACSYQGSELVQIAAFESLVQVATEYYDFLLPYMDTIGPLTWQTIKSAPEKVAIPAMEFWSTVCDEELDRNYCSQNTLQPSLNLIPSALPFLVPLLNQTLTRQQSEEEEDDTWNLAMAAGTCLGLVAQVVGDQCVDLVLGFVQEHFGNADWKYREAAVLAYGSIMEGPSSEKMQPLVRQSFPTIVRTLRDPSVAVRDTLAWTLGRIVQFHPAIVPVRDLAPILAEQLGDVPRVAVNICWAIQVLAEESTASPVSEFFSVLAQALLEVIKRPDAEERQLRMAAYNALGVLVSRSGDECLPHMESLLHEMLNQLSASFGTLGLECELQGFICGVLTALVPRLRERCLPAADRIMEEALKVIKAYQTVKGSPHVLQEEALLLVSALANAAGANFEKYMPHFAPHLRVGLQNFEDVQVCLMSTGVVGDVCRALDAKILMYCDTMLEILYSNLHNQGVDRKIKAAIMSCFGDIALAITGDFEKYLAPVVRMLQEASATRLQDAPSVNEEWVDYLNTLREGVLEAYTGIIHGLRSASKLHLFKEHVNTVLHFVKEITTDSSVSEPVMKAAVGVIGDLVFVFQQELTAHLGGAPFLATLVEYAARSMDPGMRQTAAWLQSLLHKYSAPAQA